MTVHRALDANLNRALEALRVVEDHARFVARRSGPARRAKQIRHAVRTAVHAVATPQALLAARDAQGDVGRPGQALAPVEAGREDAADVVGANLARAQEALRALEEFAKPTNPAQAAVLAEQRYACYELGRVLLQGQRSWAGREVYAILGPRPGRGDVPSLARACLEGGVRLLQLRLKGGSDREALRVAEAVQALCLEFDAWLVVNDRVDLALAVGAEGVHLGVDDLPPERVRGLVGGRIVGASAHDAAELAAACAGGVDYVGFGTLFSSGTKPELRAQGVELLGQLTSGLEVPVFGIGGVTLDNAAQVIGAGATGVAIGGALLDAPDVAQAAAQLVERVAAALAERAS